MKPNLVLIEGDVATQYVNGKPTVKAKIDFSAGRRSVIASIEHFRQYGLQLRVI
jgi:hypothetical protein